MEEFNVDFSVTNSSFDANFGNVIKGDPGTPGKDGKDGTNGKDGEDGKAGKDAYEYAQDGGYLGTREEFAAKLATDYIDWFGVGISIPEGADLNNYKTNGKYYCSSESRAQTLLNRPDKMNTNFVMWVFSRTSSSIKSQLMLTLAGKMYIRSANSNAWRAWVAYTTSAEIEAIREELMAQVVPNFANDISECTDTTKLYVLPDGYIYAYKYSTVIEKGSNKFVPSKATLNQRLSSSNDTVSGTALGSFVTDYIPISNMESVTPYNARLNWEIYESSDNKVLFYDSNKSKLGNILFLSNGTNWSKADGETILDLKNVRSSNDIAPADWSQVAYVRFQLFVKENTTSLTSSEIENLTITFDAENTTSTKYQWTNTGHAFVPADYEDRVIDLEKDVSKLKSGINGVEITVPEFWEDAVNECISKIKALQIGRNCVTFPFFSDNHQRNGYVGLLIAKVMKECHIPYAFYGGDSISSGYIADEAAMIAEDKAFDEVVSYIPNGRFCRAVGNHDGYWAVDADNKNYYTDAQNYELFLREESIAQNKHFGGDGTYYYVDDIASKVRWVVLDTNDNKVEQAQIDWLQNTALSFNESGWAVVFISHQPISNHYHALISNFDTIIAVIENCTGDSQSNEAEVVGWFSGHIHRDRIYTGVAVNTTDDSEGETMPFKQITITSDHTGIAYDAATKHTVANDDKSHAIDFVTINKTTRTVNLTRLGIGNNRSYTY